MTGLVLDPGDGRDVGLRLVRHLPLQLVPETRPGPGVTARRDVVDEMCLRLCGDLVAKVEGFVVDAGVWLELGDVQTGGRWVSAASGDRFLLEVEVSYRIRRPTDMP